MNFSCHYAAALIVTKTNFKQQSPSSASVAGRPVTKFSTLYGIQMIYDCFHKILLGTYYLLNEFIPHPPTYFFMNHFNILPPMPSSSK